MLTAQCLLRKILNFTEVIERRDHYVATVPSQDVLHDKVDFTVLHDEWVQFQEELFANNAAANACDAKLRGTLTLLPCVNTTCMIC